MGTVVSRARYYKRSSKIWQFPGGARGSSSGSSSGVPGTSSDYMTSHARERSRRIDVMLAKDRQKLTKLFKILILGTAESGKSTLFKQMRVLHMKGFGKGELRAFRTLIHTNCIDALLSILMACKRSRIRFKDRTLKENVERFKLFDRSRTHHRSSATNESSLLTPTMAHIMLQIWRHPIVKSVFDQRFEILMDFTFPDSTQYFLDNLNRIGSGDYSPSTEDILRSRLPTTGIREIQFEYRNTLLRMVDVGGQRSEQKKWIHLFDDVQCVLFIAALSDYDVPLPYNDSPKTSRAVKNRLVYGMILWQRIAESLFLSHSSLVLFLNKKDVLETKITQSPMKEQFPDYRGADTYGDASVYILDKFTKEVNRERGFYAHFTEAVNTEHIDHIFSICMTRVFKDNLNRCGMI